MARCTRLFVAAIVGVVFYTTSALAQGGAATPQELKFDCKKEKDPFAPYCEDINNFLKDASANRGSDGKVDRRNALTLSDLRAFLFVDASPDRFSALLAPRVALIGAIGSLPKSPDNSPGSAAVLSGANQNRPDEQTTAGSNTSGTTSLVEKAGAPAIMAFALESGALTRSVSGNTATLSGNADGIIRALTGQQALCFDCPNALGTAFLKDLNLSAGFLINQSSATSVSTTGPANTVTPTSVTSVLIPKTVGKLSNLTARYQIWNPYDPRSSKFRQAWSAAANAASDQINTNSKDLQQKLVALLNKNPIKDNTQFQGVLESYRGTFFDDADAGDLDKLRKDFLDLFNVSVASWTNSDPQFIPKIAELNISLAQYKAMWNQLLDSAKGQPLLTLEYAFNRPQSQPETHDFRFIYGYSPVSPAVTLLSVNAAVSIYGGTIPIGAKYGRLHDGQIAVEFDRSIPVRSNPTQGTFSLAAYWQYQPSPSVLNITAGNLAPGTNIALPGDAQVLLGTSGSLWVTQAKFTLNGRSGIKVPIAVKWSNKTDLLSGNRFSGQVGISYDFSSLSNLFGSSSGQ
jgi:hypothetical protein